MYSSAGALREFLRTKLAQKLFCFQVYKFVLIQQFRAGEGATTNIALVWPFLPTGSSDMILKNTLLRERSIAFFTFIRPGVCVPFQVFPFHGHSCKRSITYCANERFLVVVASQMVFKIFRFGEFLGTNIAFVCLDSSVREHVAMQAGGVLEFFCRNQNHHTYVLWPRPYLDPAFGGRIDSIGVGISDCKLCMGTLSLHRADR